MLILNLMFLYCCLCASCLFVVSPHFHLTITWHLFVGCNNETCAPSTCCSIYGCSYEASSSFDSDRISSKVNLLKLALNIAILFFHTQYFFFFHIQLLYGFDVINVSQIGVAFSVSYTEGLQAKSWIKGGGYAWHWMWFVNHFLIFSISGAVNHVLWNAYCNCMVNAGQGDQLSSLP